jgi:gliding motility-associated-like protein
MTKSAAVKVYPRPEADFSVEPETASVLVPEIFFYDKSANSIKWEWSYGDNSLVQFQRNSSHAFADTGVYEVRLIATSNKGCVDTAYRKVMIKGEFAIYIPNAFSPNHDGVNDNFAPIGLGIKSYTMSIYNRWGLKIMDTSDILHGWDGINPGSEMNCPDDVYVFVMSVTDIQNKTHEYTGRVSLVR